MKLGTLYGVSVGTGDPELITVKGLRIIQNSKIIAFPAGINNRLGTAQSIISGWLQPHQQTLPLKFPYVRDVQTLQTAWLEAARTVGSYLQQGADITFACLGDLSFYGTFTYLAQNVQQLYPEANIETVPGVCSPMAIASVLEVPLTVDRQRLAILPAIYAIAELETALDWAEVVVLLKVSSVYREVWQILQQRGLLDYASLVDKATFAEQKIYRNLTDYPQLDLSYFSIMLIRQPNQI